MKLFGRRDHNAARDAVMAYIATPPDLCATPYVDARQPGRVFVCNDAAGHQGAHASFLLRNAPPYARSVAPADLPDRRCALCDPAADAREETRHVKTALAADNALATTYFNNWQECLAQLTAARADAEALAAALRTLQSRLNAAWRTSNHQEILRDAIADVEQVLTNHAKLTNPPGVE